MIHRLSICCLMIAISVRCFAAENESQKIEIGAVETIRPQWDEISTSCTVRLLFKRTANQNWVPYPHWPDEEEDITNMAKRLKPRYEWIEYDHGKPMYDYTTEPIRKFEGRYGDTGYQRLIRTNAPRKHFAYKEDSDLGGPRNPHVLLTKPVLHDVADRDGWTTATGITLTSHEKTVLMGRLIEANKGPELLKLVDAKLTHFEMTVDQSFKSSDTTVLMKVKAVYSWSDNEKSEDVLWVARAYGRSMFITGELTSGAESEYPEMRLIDFGDYDGDGRTEFVFALYGYDYGGYRLFWDDFRESATIDWIYH